MIKINLAAERKVQKSKASSSFKFEFKEVANDFQRRPVFIGSHFHHRFKIPCAGSQAQGLAFFNDLLNHSVFLLLRMMLS